MERFYLFWTFKDPSYSLDSLAMIESSILNPLNNGREYK
jgi:hypothetical protein